LVEVFAHSGAGKLTANDYNGVEVLFEIIAISGHRVDLQKLTPAITNEPDISGGYIFKKDKDSAGDLNFNTSGANGFGGEGLKFHDPKPREFQAVANATKDRPDAMQIHTMLLRSMQQAIYTGINSGHFGLAYEAYTHFTSPIRRYPDLLVHRVIKALLGGKRYHLVTGASNPAPSNRKTTKPVRTASSPGSIDPRQQRF